MKLRLNVDGKTYEVEVEVLEEGSAQPGQPRPAAPVASSTPVVAPVPSAPPAAAPSAAVGDESKVFRSPISGVVVRVTAQVGQTVAVNDELLVLEAMKMETVIASHTAGKIASINADVGDSVQVKQVLVEFE